MEPIKTDNSYLKDKMLLRAEHLPPGDVKVLDCFCGQGVLWRGVQKITDRKIDTLPIDTRDDIDFFHLAGNNADFLLTLDLSRFNVIDLDAYGVPYDQLKILFERGYKGVVFVTFIGFALGSINNNVLNDIGFTDEMIRKIPTLFCKRGWEYFLQWLALNGVTEITHRSKQDHAMNKHYLTFSCAEESAEGYNNRVSKRAVSRA